MKRKFASNDCNEEELPKRRLPLQRRFVPNHQQQLILNGEPVKIIIPEDRLRLNDPVDQYLEEIYLNLFTSEEGIKDYFTFQRGRIDQKMRKILLDWIIEVTDIEGLSSRVVYLSKKIVDIILGKMKFTRHRLQLLGVVAMFLASKFEDDIQAPTIHRFIELSDDSCTLNEVKDLEVEVLRELEYKLAIPVEIDFLPRFIRAATYNYNFQTIVKVTHLSHCFAEMSLLHSSLLKFRASIISMSCVTLALATIGLPVWTPVFERSYPKTHFLIRDEVTLCLNELLQQAKGLKTSGHYILVKYSKPEFGKLINEMVIPDCIPFFNIY